MRTILLAFIVHALAHLAECDVSSNRTYVTIPLGKIEGYYARSWKNRVYRCFTRIPYAKPPTGELRFEPPVPIEKWDQTLRATLPSPWCSQFDMQSGKAAGQEDCLYLNIFAPEVDAKNASLPVLFWIHGGAFQLGNSWKHSPKYLMDKNVIVVMISYRVSLFGFLSTRDELIPGNMGLKDQSLALKWVADHIKHFQGDPKRVTLAGVSAGAVSVHYHYLSPMSVGLFHGGVSVSGVALAPWALTDKCADVTGRMAAALECPANDTAAIKRCLKAKSAEELIYASQKVVKSLNSSGIIFLPVVENTKSGYFINQAPLEIMKSGKINDVPWVTGVVKDEGLMMTGSFYTNETTITAMNANWEVAGGPLICLDMNIPKEKWSAMLNSAKQRYLGKEPICPAMMKNLTRLVGDYLVAIHAQRAVVLQASAVKSPIYYYYYTFEAVYSAMPVGPNKNLTVGVSHGDDTSFIFQSNGVNPTTTEADKAMLEELLNFWESVVETGKPNIGVPWLDIGSSKDFQYMHIDGPKNNRMEVNNNLADIKFWTDIGL